MPQPREHQVPCQAVGCKALTYNWSAYCDDHVHRRCVVCAREAEVTWPDKHGDQIGYCGRHEPSDLGVTS